MSSPERKIDTQWGPAGSNVGIAEGAAQSSGASPRNQPPESGEFPDSSREFWTELNATLDEFFAVLGASKERLAELSSEIVKRDRLIALLDAQNSALRARLGIADGGVSQTRPLTSARPSATAARESHAPAASATSSREAAPETAGPAHGLWSKLKNLEREL